MPKKQKLYTCQKCGAKKPANQIYSYVDGNNIAITRNSPLLCHDCYVKQYGKNSLEMFETEEA